MEKMIFMILLMIPPILFLIITAIVWKIWRYCNSSVHGVQFYPPHNLNSLEIGYLYHGYVREKDVASLIIQLANKGFIKIQETSGRTMINSFSNFNLIRLKMYNGSNILERIFMNGLFRMGRTETSELDLRHNFPLIIDDLTHQLEKGALQNYKEELYPIKQHVMTYVFIGIIILLTLFLPIGFF